MRLALISLLLATPALAAPDGAAIYKRCAACHLPTGAGVPGAYPPLNADVRALAAKPEGRRYLTLVVAKGVSGPITVEGKSYRGFMPAQAGLDDANIAAVLTHVTGTIARTGKTPKPFTADEVAKAKASGVALNAVAVGKLHAEIAGK